jgi:hypothetical protein
MPEASRVSELIRQSGNQGISRGRLGSLVRLERKTLDDLLAAMTGASQISVTMENGLRIYRAR